MSKTTKFNLGQLSITSNQEKPATPAEVSVRAKRLQNAQEAEAVLNFKGVADAVIMKSMKKMATTGVS